MSSAVVKLSFPLDRLMMNLLFNHKPIFFGNSNRIGPVEMKRYQAIKSTLVISAADLCR